MELQVTAQKEIPRITDIVQIPSGSVVPENKISETKAILNARGIELPSSMGTFDGLKSFAERIFFRKFIRKHPEQTVKLTWFEGHVPPGGQTVISYEETKSQESGVEFNFSGLDIGLGRSVQMEKKETAAPRSKCCIYFFNLLIQPTEYAIRDRKDFEIDVLKVIDYGSEEVDKCPYCGISPADINSFDYETLPGTDRRKDTVKTTQTSTVELTDKFKVQSGIQIPGVPFKLSLSGGFSKSQKLQVENSMLPGFRYLPYLSRGADRFQTPMWAIEK